MAKLRVKQDCEHGPAGTVFEMDDERVGAFLAEGKVELAPEEPVVEEAAPEPVAATAPPPKPPVPAARAGTFAERAMVTKAEPKPATPKGAPKKEAAKKAPQKPAPKPKPAPKKKR